MVFNKKQNAFTLMEVMIAIVIIGILATLAGPQIIKLKKKIEVNATKGTMAAIESALHDYRDDMGKFPTQREGLDVLVKQPSGKASEKWNGPYIKGKTEIPLDKWSAEFEYNVLQNIKNKNRFKYYEIISYGPNGEEDEKDNIYMGE